LKLVLASQSPRRKELLQHLDIDFTVNTPGIEEITNLASPQERAMDLSLQKAIAVAKKISSQPIKQNEIVCIIASDTIVHENGRDLGKPKDKKDALDTLLSLSGKEHLVITGVSLCLLEKSGEITHKEFYDQTRVRFDKVSKKFLKAYVEKGESLDKAGAYGIQGAALSFIDSIKGSYSNVVGLPVSKLRKELLNFLEHNEKLPESWKESLKGEL
jgi:septum formation protein